MKNFIESLIIVSKDIMIQLLGEKVKLEKISFVKQFRIKESINMITSIRSEKNSFQIIINYSEELAKKISSTINGGIPIVQMDCQSKEAIIEISKLIVSNAIIDLDDYDETCTVSPILLVESSDMKYSADEDIAVLKFVLMEELLTILIVDNNAFDIK